MQNSASKPQKLLCRAFSNYKEFTRILLGALGLIRDDE